MTMHGDEENIYMIVVNYNGAAWNAQCIDSVLRQEGVRPHIIFVDNASTDGSLEIARQTYGDENRVEFLALPRNLLFAAGCNAGMARALRRNADFIALLNNDAVMEQGCLAALCGFLRAHSDAAAVQPLLLRMDAPDRVASAGCRISRMGGAWDIANGAPAASLPPIPGEVPGVTAGAALWRTDTLRRIGLFDEEFGMYFEDVDLSLRARRAGYALYLLPTATVRHAVSATTGKEPSDFLISLCQANALRIVLKHWPTRRLAADCCAWLLVTSAALLSNLVRRRGSTAKGYAKGLLGGLRLAPGALRRRLRCPQPENDALQRWIDRQHLLPPRPEA